MDGLEAEPKPGGHQASAECTFKMCTLQGFGNISFFMLTSSQLFFHFCPTHHKSFCKELHGPAGSVICGAPRSPVTSHDKVLQNLLGTAWAAELPPAVDPEPETPHLPSSSAHRSLTMMDDGYRRLSCCLTPSPGSHTNTCCGAASAHQTEQEQQLDVTLRCP